MSLRAVRSAVRDDQFTAKDDRVGSHLIGVFDGRNRDLISGADFGKRVPFRDGMNYGRWRGFDGRERGRFRSG